MDLLPQEIIDEIIDNLPRSSLRSSSLVAKRWRTRSQQRALEKILFINESMVKTWHTDIQRNHNEISSRVQSARFKIAGQIDPVLFCCVLENFSSLTTLRVAHMDIPDEIPEHISRGEVGKTVTTLHLNCLLCPLSTVISTILAFQNLENLFLYDVTTPSREQPSTYSALPRRKPLDLLRVVGCVGQVAEILANVQIVSRRLILGVISQNIQSLLFLSSATVVELELKGVRSLCVDGKGTNENLTDYPYQSTSSPIVSASSFPALTSLTIYIDGRAPSSHLVNTLASISSVPALVSIDLGCLYWPHSRSDMPYTWNGLDIRLAQMAKNTTVEGGLVLTLTRWRKRDQLVPEALLPRFGGVAKIVAKPPDQNVLGVER